MIPFNKPYFSGRELKYIEEVCHSTTMSGNGQFTKKCHAFFEKKYVPHRYFQRGVKSGEWYFFKLTQ